MTINHKTIDLSLIIACYNEAGHLEKSISEIASTLKRTSYNYEIIFIDDCSKDSTREIITRLVADSPETLKAYFIEKNGGRGAAVNKGIHLATGRWVGFVDIDLEIGAHHIPYCLAEFDKGADVVTGWRIYKINPFHLSRHILSRGYSQLVRLILKLPYHDTETGFKFFKTQSILKIIDTIKSNGWFWDTEVMALCNKHNLTVIEKPCLFIRNFSKKSTVRPLRDSIQYFISLLKFARSKHSNA